MAMFDFRCVECSAEFERFLHPSEYTEITTCDCGGTAQMFYSFQRPHSYTGMSEATVCYRNSDGSIGVLAHKDARIPVGSERIELRSAADVRRVEREMTAQEYRKFCDKQEREEQSFGAYAAAQRAELRERMKHMSERGKAFAQTAIRENDNKPRQKFQTNVFFEAFSMDASNREAHRSEHTDWRPRK